MHVSRARETVALYVLSVSRTGMLSNTDKSFILYWVKVLQHFTWAMYIYRSIYTNTMSTKNISASHHGAHIATLILCNTSQMNTD